MEQSPYSEANTHSVNQDIPRLLWFIACPQDLSTGPYPDPDESSPQFPTLFP